MGTVIENKKTKEKCQIFTPNDIVSKMLDHLGYCNNLYGKTIVETSCGNGQFLKEIVKRYIKDAQKTGLSRTKIKNGLGRDIFGIELDSGLYQECIDALNTVTDEWGIKRVSWQIKNADALREPYQKKFDFAVGNPPYVSYWDLEVSEREYVEKNFTTCKFGARDYSYAFLQDAFNQLCPTGKMAYIIPNSIFKTKSGRHIRALLHPYLVEVLDYTTTSVFEKVITSPAIVVVDRNPQDKTIVYQDLSRKIKCTVNRESIADEWLFTCQKQDPALEHRFGEYFRVATGIATQCNAAYVLAGCTEDGDYLLFNGWKIEKNAVRKAASPRGKALGISEHIIFPYYYINGTLMHYDETEYKEKYPYAYEYLKNKRNLLNERDADEKAKWFEYGRSQALTHINQKKVLISTVITGRVHAYPLEEDEVPYSGLFIVPKANPAAIPLTEVMTVLDSPEFMKYLESHGINASGKSIRIVAKNIEDYRW